MVIWPFIKEFDAVHIFLFQLGFIYRITSPQFKVYEKQLLRRSLING